MLRPDPTKKFRMHTLGCKTNQYETQAMREALLSSGNFAEAPPGAGCDVCVVNTCTVTAKADRESRRIIRRCHRESPHAAILVTGCLAELDSDAIKTLPGVAHIVKNADKDKVTRILTSDERRATSDETQVFTPLKISAFSGRTKAFIKVQDGCDNFCSYCKIPYVRGRSRSRPLGEVVEEAVRLRDGGYKELVLTGICLGDWGRGLEGSPGLADLITEIDRIDGDFRLRLSSVEPEMVSAKLLSAIAASYRVCPHLHIPLQSGSDRVLRSMRRKYTAAHFITLVKKAKRAIPGLSLTTDVMIGFPGESARDFRATARALGKTAPSRMHIFTYSDRGPSSASALKRGVRPADVIKRRERLELLAANLSYRYRRGFLNSRVEGLVETKRDSETGHLTGYTEGYIKFLLDGPDSLMGKMLPLKIIKVVLKTTFCKLL